MRRNSGIKKFLWLGGALVVGSMFAQQIKDFLSKVPVIGDWINKKSSNV